MLVMSGASASSPVESGKVVVFEPARDESPEAVEEPLPERRQAEQEQQAPLHGNGVYR